MKVSEGRKFCQICNDTESQNSRNNFHNLSFKGLVVILEMVFVGQSEVFVCLGFVESIPFL